MFLYTVKGVQKSARLQCELFIKFLHKRIQNFLMCEALHIFFHVEEFPVQIVSQNPATYLTNY
jgi:hypothetical protein